MRWGEGTSCNIKDREWGKSQQKFQPRNVDSRMFPTCAEKSSQLLRVMSSPDGSYQGEGACVDIATVPWSDSRHDPVSAARTRMDTTPTLPYAMPKAHVW